MSQLVSHVNTNLQEEKKIISINSKRPFIMLDAKIESMNLSDCAYRLYCRIVFRGRNSKRGFCENRDTTLKETGISHEKRTRALKELEDLKMTRTEMKKGLTANIYPTLPSEWTQPTRRKIRTGTTRRKTTTSPTTKTGRVPAVKSGPELDPCELDQTKREEDALSDSSNEKTKAGGTEGSSSEARKTFQALADLLTHRRGTRFENSASKCLMLALDRTNAQIDAAISFLAQNGQVFTKSDLSSDEKILACLLSVIDASPEEREVLKSKYTSSPRHLSVMAKPEDDSPKELSEESRKIIEESRARRQQQQYKKGA